MEKVTLTKEQVSAIEEIKDKDYAINILALNKRPDHPLASLEMSQIAKLLYGLVNYEIEPEFKVGDKVFDETSQNCPLITVTHQDEKILYGYWADDIKTCLQKKYARHATEEEIYWREMLGRDFIGDFRLGDVIYTELNVPIIIGEYDVPGKLISLQRTMKFHRNGALKGIYPAESFKPFS